MKNVRDRKHLLRKVVEALWEIMVCSKKHFLNIFVRHTNYNLKKWRIGNILVLRRYWEAQFSCLGEWGSSLAFTISVYSVIYDSFFHNYLCRQDSRWLLKRRAVAAFRFERGVLSSVELKSSLGQWTQLLLGHQESYYFLLFQCYWLLALKKRTDTICGRGLFWMASALLSLLCSSLVVQS